ncbi:MAG: O-antigen ligase family protein [Rickettsiales bacterium]|nr:O-antigen ligase family protein [Rickettsiales bacterium]
MTSPNTVISGGSSTILSGLMWLWCLASLGVLYATGEPLYLMVLLLLPLSMIMGLQLPFLLAMGFVLFSFFRLHEAFPLLMPFHIPKLLSLGAISSFGLLLLQKRIKLFWTPELTCFSLFFLYCTMGTLLAENRGLAFAYWSGIYVKIAIMVLIITYLTQTPRQLRWVSRLIVLAGIAVALVTIANKLQGIGLVEGTRVTISRELGSILGDPNDLALTLLFPFSFAITLAMRWGVRWVDRFVGLFGTGIILLAILYTQSRGGLLGVATVMFVLAWFRVRSKTLLITGGIIALLALFTMAGITDRISGGAQEAGLDESANIRLYAWFAAFKMALYNPLTGVGLDNFYANFFFYSDFWDNKNHAVHSTWFGVMAETGFIGFGLFVAMIWQLLRAARKLHMDTLHAKGEDAQALSLSITSEALLAGILSFIVSGTFLTQGFTWPVYILLALTVAAVRIHQHTLKQSVVNAHPLSERQPITPTFTPLTQ